VYRDKNKNKTQGLGNLDEATQSFEKALVFDPENEPLKTTIRDIRLKLEHEQRAQFAPTPVSFDGILDDVPTAAPTPVDPLLSQRYATPNDYMLSTEQLDMHNAPPPYLTGERLSARVGGRRGRGVRVESKEAGREGERKAASTSALGQK